MRRFASSGLWIMVLNVAACLYGQKPDIGTAWDELMTDRARWRQPSRTHFHSAAGGSETDGYRRLPESFLFRDPLELRTVSDEFHRKSDLRWSNQRTGHRNLNPAGITVADCLQPGSNRVESFISLGTRGYGSDRVNTHLSLRYRQDLTKVQIGSPAQNVVETSYGSRLWEFLDASVEINSKPTDGALAGTSLQFGRLNVYGANWPHSTALPSR